MSTITLDKLKAKCRADFTKYIRPLLIKNNCECCGSINNLELHHEEQFIELLQQTLDNLNIDVYNISENDYKNIRLHMLGLQIKSKYITLCSDCHDKIPRKSWFIKNNPNDKINKINFIKEYLDNIIGKRLYGEDKTKLVNKLDIRINGKKVKSAKKINAWFVASGLEYVVLTKRDNARTLKDGSPNPNKDKNYWIIDNGIVE